jgi:hypothetical protein
MKGGAGVVVVVVAVVEDVVWVEGDVKSNTT